MAKDERLAGSTSVILEVFAQNSASTTGAGLAGLVFNSAGLTAYYKRAEDSASVALTLANVTTIGTFANNGFREVDATNMPGIYEFDPPNAAFAANAKTVTFYLKGATNLAPVVLEVALKAVNTQDSIRAGMTALPGVNAEGAGGLYTRGSGAGQINQQTNGQIDAAVQKWLNTTVLTPSVNGLPEVNVQKFGNTTVTGRDIGASVLLSNGSGTGQLLFASGVVQADTRQVLGTAVTEGGAGRLAAAFTKLFDIAVPVLTAASVNQTGDNYPRLGAPAGASVSADIAAVKTETGTINTNVTAVNTAVGAVNTNVSGTNTAVAGANTAIGGVNTNVSGTNTVVGAVNTTVNTINTNVDAAVSSRAAAATALSTVQWTNTRAGYLDNLNGLRIKKNTALAGFAFLMVLSADHITPATGLTVVVQRSIDGAAFGNATNTPATEVSDGVYKIDLSAADLNGNVVTLKMTSGTADQRTIVIATEP